MVAKAAVAGLIDRPPNLALSRVYAALAQGVYTTLLDPAATVVTVSYGPGQPANPTPVFPIPGGGAMVGIGLGNLEPERFAAAAAAASTFTGIGTPGFFTGVSGMIEYLQTAIGFRDFYAPTATGAAILPAGGLVVDPDAIFNNVVDAAQGDVMVVQLGVHVDDPTGTIEDPIVPGRQNAVGEPFYSSELLIRAVATALAAELAFGTNAALLVSGSFFPPPVTPIAGVTPTTVIF